MGYGEAAHCLLGNHDLHLLAVACGAQTQKRLDTLDDVLLAPDRDTLVGWLRQQHLALLRQVGEHSLLMVHAGVLPAWSGAQTLALADEVHAFVQHAETSDLRHFFQQMYGNQPDRWSDTLSGIDRQRVIINALTRLRFCSLDGRMEFATKEGAGAAPAGFMPWFDVPGRLTAPLKIAFGHWSTLGWLDREDVLALDTGCVWGGHLSALDVRSYKGQWQQVLVQVKCEAAQPVGF
jgi:bis(5'-nucleosyl)-tetraphosphatase (symmetrical)